jgi:hypothetical protein
MTNGLTLNLNKFGFYFWFILFGFTTMIFSIIYNDKYVNLGFLITIYGMVAFLLDLLIDRVFTRLVKENLTLENMNKVPTWGHLLRFGAHLVLIFVLLMLIENKYNFI